MRRNSEHSRLFQDLLVVVVILPVIFSARQFLPEHGISTHQINGVYKDDPLWCHGWLITNARIAIDIIDDQFERTLIPAGEISPAKEVPADLTGVDVVILQVCPGGKRRHPVAKSRLLWPSPVPPGDHHDDGRAFG